MKEEIIKKFMSALNISREAALELYNYDERVEKSNKPVEGEVVVKKIPKTSKKKGIQKEELDAMKDLLSKMFPNGEEFKNSQLSPLCEELNLTNRQTPSRLKALKEEGFLEDLGGSPKKYKIK